MDGLAQTARGVLGSALVLLLLGAVFVWSLNDASQVKLSDSPPVDAAAPSRSSFDETIRVALTRRNMASVRLRIESGYRITPLGGSRFSRDDASSASVVVAEPLAECAVTADGTGIAIDGRRFEGSGIEIIPDASPAIWIEGRKYRGSVRLHIAGDDRLRAVNVLPIEEYVAAVVDAEMPAHFPTAAREAQAIVARTYAVSCRRDPPHEWFDLYSTPISQNYLGVVYEGSAGRLLAGETTGSRAATAETTGMVCTYEGALFRTYYSACCGGHTLSGDAVFHDDTPSLRAVACGGCSDAPLYRWTRTLPVSSSNASLFELARARVPAFRGVASAQAIDADDEPSIVTVNDGRRSVRLPAVEVRSAFGLPSLCFKLDSADGEITVEGRGHGHGVGLCQWGAKGLAERGMSCTDILRHYYPGCNVATLQSSSLPRSPSVAQ